MEFLRAHRERRNAQVKDRQVQDRQVKDREPLGSIEDIWTPATQMATVGIFILLLGAFLYFCRPVLLPVVAAVLIGTTLAPIVKAGARHRIFSVGDRGRSRSAPDRRRRLRRHAARQSS